MIVFGLTKGQGYKILISLLHCRAAAVTKTEQLKSPKWWQHGRWHSNCVISIILSLRSRKAKIINEIEIWLMALYYFLAPSWGLHESCCTLSPLCGICTQCCTLLFSINIFLTVLSVSQAVFGVRRWPPAAPVRRGAFRGHWLAGLHLHTEGTTACATLRREAKVS